VTEYWICKISEGKYLGPPVFVLPVGRFNARRFYSRGAVPKGYIVVHVRLVNRRVKALEDAYAACMQISTWPQWSNQTAIRCAQEIRKMIDANSADR
jgi:hypothetical protein